MRILFVCFWRSLTGYGRAARDYVAALTAAGHDVRIVDWGSLDPKAPVPVSPEARYSHLDALVRPWPRPSSNWLAGAIDVVVYHGQPRLLAQMAEQQILFTARDHKLTHVAMTTWETSSFPGVYESWLGGAYAAVLVPSAWCNEVVAAGGALDVHVVPHCFDPDLWQPHSAPRKPDDVTRFYALGAWGERKNHQAILRAYLHAFTADDPVSLTIRTAAVDSIAASSEIRSLLGRSGLSPADIPKISIHFEPMSEGELHAFHADHDVFVSASRGEAWGLPLFEAVAMGKSVITPTETGERDYLICDRPGGLYTYSGLFPVGGTTVPCFAGAGAPVIEGGRVVGEAVTHVPGMTCRQTWQQPDELALASAMASHGSYPPSLPLLGGTPHDREWLAQRFAYAPVARLLVETLESL